MTDQTPRYGRGTLTRKQITYVVVAVAIIIFLLGWKAGADSIEDLDCVDFVYQEQSQAVLDRDSSDPHRLDADNDGISCESLPRLP
jgi:hypothetical protein